MFARLDPQSMSAAHLHPVRPVSSKVLLGYYFITMRTAFVRAARASRRVDAALLPMGQQAPYASPRDALLMWHPIYGYPDALGADGTSAENASRQNNARCASRPRSRPFGIFKSAMGSDLRSGSATGC